MSTMNPTATMNPTTTMNPHNREIVGDFEKDNFTDNFRSQPQTSGVRNGP